MDLSPTDLKLISFDLYKTDEKYNFKLTDILRQRSRPLLFVMDSDGELIYCCKPDDKLPTQRLSQAVTRDLITQAIAEVRLLIEGRKRGPDGVVRQVIVDKPGEKSALVVINTQFWSIRLFDLDGGVLDPEGKVAALVEPIGDPENSGLDLNKAKGLYRLSKREADVVEELVCGSTDKEIAAKLGISVETVRAYLKSIRAKLGVSTRTAIVSAVHNLRNAQQSKP